MNQKKAIQQSFNEEVERIMQEDNVNRFEAKRILRTKLLNADIE
jgi:hypothetical protein